MDERARIAMLARVLGTPPEALRARGVETGIGDDAAVLRSAAARLVWTIDEQVEGTHFRRALLAWQDVGWRSVMAAVSDVAAMGAEPWCILAALVLPDDVDDAALEAIAMGQRDAAAAAGAPIVGGNLARGPALSLATTVVGTCERAVSRAGARPGDGLWLAGDVGLAALGFAALEAGRGEASGSGSREPLCRAVDAWRRPRALVAEGRAMAPSAHAAIDVSDGLSLDAARMAEASGVQIVIDEDAIAASPDLRRGASALGRAALDLALGGGEDYALVVAAPVPIAGFRRIGDIREGAGLVLRGRHAERALVPRGFDHFDRREPPDDGLSRKI